MAQVTRSRGRRLMGEINVVPYIDVMLVLLIIFMVTAPMLSQGVKVDLPKAAAEPLPADQDPLVLSIDVEGRMFLNIGDPKSALDPDRILELASAVLRREPERPVLVKADRTVQYGRVVEGMALLQQAGAQKVGFATESPASPAARKSGTR
jgi:biopolymer transport protein TolR